MRQKCTKVRGGASVVQSFIVLSVTLIQGWTQGIQIVQNDRPATQHSFTLRNRYRAISAKDDTVVLVHILCFLPF